MRHRPKNHWLSLLIVSFIGAFVVAVAFVVTLILTLPPSDGAYGERPFSDPFVIPIMSIGAGLAGLVAFLFALWLLRRSDLRRSSWVTLLITLVVMIAATAVGSRLGAGGLGIPSSFIAMVCSMVFCRSRFPLQQALVA